VSRVLGTVGRAIGRGSRRAAKAVSPEDFRPLRGERGQERFKSALEKARASMDEQSALQASPIGENFEGQLFLTRDGNAGFAIKPDGELAHLFGNPASGTKGVMDAALARGRQEGATRLEAFSGLSDSYARRGAVETQRFEFNPKEAPPGWDTQKMGTPDYVFMDLPPAQEAGALAQPTRRRRQPPMIEGAERQAYPGIYKDPREIAAEAAARVAPEDPALRRLFGVGREDLYDIGRSRVGNEAPNIAVPPGARGSNAAQRVTTDRNANRIMDALSEAEAYPHLIHGADGWYVMDPAYQRLVELHGPEEALRLYNDLNNFTGMASPGSDVLTELNRGTGANWLHQQGRFDDFQQYGGLAEHRRGSDFPDDMRGIIGHPYHSTAHSIPMSKYAETGQLDMQSPKVPLYIQSSGVPDTGFQTSLPVGDAHFSRGVGLADVRASKAYAGSVSMPELSTVGPWWRDQVAAPLGLQSVPAQARSWTVFGPQTGVDTPLGAPKLELLAQKIMGAAERLGISPETARDLALSGKIHLAGAGAAILGGVLHTPEENEAMAATGPARRAGTRALQEGAEAAGTRAAGGVRNAAVLNPTAVRDTLGNITGMVNRGARDPATALDDLMNLAERVNRNQNPRHFPPAVKQQMLDEIYGEIGKLQNFQEADHRPFLRTQTDIPDSAGMLDDVQWAPKKEGEVLQDVDRMYRPNDTTTQFDPYAGLDQPNLSHEDMGRILSEGGELERIQQQMRQPPTLYQNPGRAQGQFFNDPAMRPGEAPGEMRTFSPEELAAVNEARGAKTSFAVAGAAGLGDSLSPYAEDAGILAQGGATDDGGRVSANPSYADAIRARNELPGVVGELRNLVERDLKRLKDTGEFAGDMVRHTGGLLLAGLTGAANLPTTVYNSVRRGDGVATGIADAGDIVNGVLDLVGTGELSDDNFIIEALGSLLENPHIARQIERLQELDQRMLADEDRPENLAWRVGSRFWLEQPIF
jgi:hypothetical protein